MPRRTMMRSAPKQSGLSLLWFIFVVAVVLVVAVVGFRVMPAYIEYFSVQKALGDALSQAREIGDTAEIRKAFQKRVDSGYIESVGGRDLEVRKVDNEYVASVAWTRKLPLVSNVSLLIEFEATAAR